MTSDISSRLTKIAIFYDGNFFSTINNYYRFSHPVKRNFNFQGFAEYVKDRIAEKESVDSEFTQVIESHWFRGKFTMSQMKDYHEDEDKLLKALTSEKYIDDSLMYANIIQHVFPMRVDRYGNAEEKGIDVWFALEAFELAFLKRFDVLALVASDTDYIPLIRKLNGLGTRVALVSWDIQETSTTTSQVLINECTHYLPMHNEIDHRYGSRKEEERASISKIFAG
ncbi:MAG: NYN domain-containing protein [Cyclobacteriaceae bacterium]